MGAALDALIHKTGVLVLITGGQSWKWNSESETHRSARDVLIPLDALRKTLETLIGIQDATADLHCDVDVAEFG